MIIPDHPINEIERQSEVNNYKLVDTLPESDFDNITSLLSTIFDVPISLITILDADRNFFKSHYGLDFNETPRNTSFCSHAILQDDIFIVEDARIDPRFKDNPIIELYQTIFYAGVPLITKNGYPLGTLCIYDHKPRQLSDSQKQVLKTIAKQVINLFELRLSNRLLDQTKQELTERNNELNKFASHVSHDLKSPLANIVSLTDLLKEEKENTLTKESTEFLGYIEDSAQSLKNYIDGILIHYKSNELLNEDKDYINVNDLFKEVQRILLLNDNQLKTTVYSNQIFTNITAVTQVLINLVDNGLKYNNKANPEVYLSFTENQKHYTFTVKDNGNGIAKQQQENVFELFNNNNQTDVKGKKGTGIGLFTVKNLVKKLGGTINLNSQLNQGSTFTFTIEK